LLSQLPATKLDLPSQESVDKRLYVLKIEYFGRSCLLTVTWEQVHELMAQTNLLLQTITLLLIISGVILARKKMFRWHGNTMLIAVMINGLMLISHMGPALVSIVRGGLSGLDAVTLLGMIHGVVGAPAVFLGVWLVGMWAYVWSDTKYCAVRKKWMWRIMMLWIAALGLGYVYYVLHIVLG
jgi:hypothetical protein